MCLRLNCFSLDVLAERALYAERAHCLVHSAALVAEYLHLLEDKVPDDWSDASKPSWLIDWLIAFSSLCRNTFHSVVSHSTAFPATFSKKALCRTISCRPMRKASARGRRSRRLVCWICWAWRRTPSNRPACLRPWMKFTRYFCTIYFLRRLIYYGMFPGLSKEYFVQWSRALFFRQIVIPIVETYHDFKQLAMIHRRLHEAFLKVCSDHFQRATPLM